MKASNYLLHADICIIEEKQKRTALGNIAKFLLFIFILSWAAMLTSCMVALPRHPPRPGVIIEQHDNGGHHDNGKHKGWRR
ncbi:MAG: hypothetical protein WCK34_17070 [Bacteroidota bacterium]